MNSPWSSIWQGPRAFDPFIVPFPIHMGYPQKGEDPPPPVGNLELIKVCWDEAGGYTRYLGD